MEDTDILALLVIALCLFGSMFFSGSETAVTSFGEHRARQLNEEGGAAGKAIRPWVDKPVFVLSTILLGNNLVNTLLTAMATSLTLRHLSGSEWSDWSVPLATGVTVTLLLVFGEVIPKAIGKMYNREVFVPAMRVLSALGRFLYPFVWSLTRITEWVVERVARSSEPNRNGHVTTDELEYLIRIAKQGGMIREQQAQMLQGIFQFEERIVRDIMIPLDRVTAIDISWPIEKIHDVAKRTGHSRLPVYAGDIDHVKGVLHIKQLVGIEQQGQDPELIHNLSRRPVFVSESLLVHDLLKRFKEHRVHLAIVVDDAGDTVGVVTLEDVLEQIVGHIFDESDRAPLYLPQEKTGIYYLDGQDSLAKVEARLGLELDEIDGVDSIGDLLTRLAGQMPITGSVFVWEGVRFKILAADPRHIIRVSVERVELEDDPEIE